LHEDRSSFDDYNQWVAAEESVGVVEHDQIDMLQFAMGVDVRVGDRQIVGRRQPFFLGAILGICLHVLAEDLAADGLEELYESVHSAIREDPSPSEKQDFTPDKSYKKRAKLTLEERKANIQAKKDARAADEDDE